MNSYNGFSGAVRQASFDWMKAEIAAGRLRPASRCQACGETRGHIDFHTEDYSKPWGPHIYAHEFCFRCHMALHARFRQPDVWRRYIEQLEAGAVYRPLMHRGEIHAIWKRGWVEAPESFGPPRPRLDFFRSLSTEREEPPDANRTPMLF